MENFNELIVKPNPPERNFSDIISHAFTNYFKVIGWGILMFVLVIIISSIASSIADSIIGFNADELIEIIRRAAKSGNIADIQYRIFEVDGYRESQLVSMVINLLLYPFYAGFLYVLQKANTGISVSFTDLFIGFRQNTVQIYLYALLSHLILFVALMMCVLHIFFVAPLLLIGLPVVFFENADCITAIKKTFTVGGKHYGTFLGIGLIAGLVAFGGVLLCGIGIFASFPFIIAASYSTYCAFCGIPFQIECRTD